MDIQSTFKKRKLIELEVYFWKNAACGIKKELFDDD